jgi:hypothetical protein
MNATFLLPRHHSRTQTLKVTGEKLLGTVKAIVHQGNIRRITIKDPEGRPIIEIPLTVGVVGAVLVPVWVAVGAIAALAADYTLVIEKAEAAAKKGAKA